MSAERHTTNLDIAVIGRAPRPLGHLVSRGNWISGFTRLRRADGLLATTMPEGMLLRSPRVASTIADPQSMLTLEAYEASAGIPPAAPLPLSTFVDYGLWFQTRLAAALDRTARTPRRSRQIFVSPDTRGWLRGHQSARRRRRRRRSVPEQARRVRYAASVCHITLLRRGASIGEFGGKRVAVIGAGQSALESAALLHEDGARSVRSDRQNFAAAVDRRAYMAGHHIGPFELHAVREARRRYRSGSAALSLIRTSSQDFRSGCEIASVPRAVRSAGSSWLPARLSSVKITTSRSVQSADMAGNEVRLRLDDGSERRVDHVLLGTGYRVDISRYELPREGTGRRGATTRRRARHLGADSTAPCRACTSSAPLPALVRSAALFRRRDRIRVQGAERIPPATRPQWLTKGRSRTAGKSARSWSGASVRASAWCAASGGAAFRSSL